MWYSLGERILRSGLDHLVVNGGAAESSYLGVAIALNIVSSSAQVFAPAGLKSRARMRVGNGAVCRPRKLGRVRVGLQA